MITVQYKLDDACVYSDESQLEDAVLVFRMQGSSCYFTISQESEAPIDIEIPTADLEELLSLIIRDRESTI